MSARQLYDLRTSTDRIDEHDAAIESLRRTVRELDTLITEIIATQARLSAIDRAPLEAQWPDLSHICDGHVDGDDMTYPNGGR